MIKKGLVCAIVVLFVGVSIVPSISGNIRESSNASSVKELLNEGFCLEKNDEILDLAVVNSYNDDVSILTGDGDGGFGDRQDYAVGNWSEDIVAGDFNKDGKLDLAVTNGGDNDVSVLLGDGNGGFEDRNDVSVGGAPIGITTGDFNKDGKLDLAVTNGWDSDISVLNGKGNGKFGNRVDYYVGGIPFSIVTGDFNKDGSLDLAATNIEYNTFIILTNWGDGYFSVYPNCIVGNSPFDIVAGDFNKDGKLDLAVANIVDNDISVLFGEGDGGFGNRQDYPVGYGPKGIDVGDFNKDGKHDLAVVNYGDNDVSILLGDGHGGFGAPQDYAVGYEPYGIVVGDFNNDGKHDIAVTNFLSNDVSVLLGDGVGGFGDRQDYAVGSSPTGIVAGDFNSNQPPEAPTIEGPNGGKPGILYDYTFNAVDPDGDDVRYIIDWGDTTSDTTAFAPSGTDVTVAHSWSKGTYIMTVKAQDVKGAIGPETTVKITIPRNKAQISQQSLTMGSSSQNVISTTTDMMDDETLTNFDLSSIPLTGRKTIYVDDDNTEGPWDGTIDHPYQHIQDGVNAASWRDTVFVFNGTYLENVIVDERISLIGEDKTTTIIDGNGTGDVVLLDGNAHWATIQGFTIQNCGDDSWEDRGIDVYTNCNTITGNIIKNNEGYGIYCMGEWDPYYTGYNIIYDNIVINNRGGIFLDMCFYNEIYDNYVADNKYTGIFVGTTYSKANMEDFLLYEYYNDVYRNTITNNGDGIDVSLPYTNVYDNSITKNKEGIFLAASNHIECAYSNIYQNNIMNNEIGITITAGICLSGTVDNNIYQNNITNNEIGITIKLSNAFIYSCRVADNNIYQNNIMYNENGVSIFEKGSSGQGILSDNKFYHNNFIGNTENAYDEKRNIWDNGSAGNYWDDYNGIDISPPYGIGDIPYNIPPRILYNKDRYPLMGPWPDVSPYNNNQANQNSQSQISNQQSTNPLILRFLERFP